MPRTERQKTWTVTGFHRDDAGVWRARVTEGGVTIDADRASGSWRALVRKAPHSRDFVIKEIRRDVVMDLAAKVRMAEDREAREEKARETEAQLALEAV